MYGIRTVFADEIEPYIRYAATPAEADELFGLYEYEFDSSLAEAGWDYIARDEGMTYARSLLEDWKAKKFYIKPAVAMRGRGLGKGVCMAFGIFAGAVAGFLTAYVIDSME